VASPQPYPCDVALSDELETRYARTDDGVDLAYRVIGDGPPDLLWSFSQLSDVEAIFEYAPIAEFLEDLASFSRVIIHDRRGMGRSGGRPGDLETDLGDLVVLLDAIGAERPYLAGAVLGGAIYAAFAARHPDRCSGLVWHGAVARQAWARDYPWGGTEEELDVYTREITDAWGTRTFAADFVAGGAPSVAGREDAIRFFARWMQATYDAPTAAAYDGAWNAVDLRTTLPSVAVPAVVISRALNPAEGAHVASLMPRARYVALDGDDFMPFFDRGPVIAEIRQLLGPG